MSIIFRTGALALALLAGTALTAAPAMAGRDHHGHKSWNKAYHKHSYKKHGYRHHRRHRGHARKHYGWKKPHYRHGAYSRRQYGYGYRRPAYGWFYGGPGFSIQIR